MAKKDGLMIAILEGMKKKGDAPEEEESEYGEVESDSDLGEEIEDSDDLGYDSAVEEMFSAFESKDKAGFKDALKNFIRLCVDEQDEIEEDY